MTAILASIGRVVNDGLSGAGRGLLLLRAIILQTPHAWRMRREILEQMQVVAIGSLPLVIVTSIFVGAVTAVQAVYQMQAYVPMKFLGTVISKSVFIELGPVLMALVVGSRLCANYAAELGTMKVTEQLDAMTIMAIDPTRYLAMPRFWASVLMIPVVTIFCDAIAIIGGYVASVMTLDVSSGVFVEGLQMFYKHSDLLGGLIKSFVFGGIIAMSGIYFGFNTKGGAEGVGRATMTAVVGSCLSVLVADYLLAIVLFQIVFEKT
ncbi:MAG: ABC transporter permease [bacterium]|nr:ABC transporter permease [bacterium]MBK7672436.1 ABC transporter permease [bacterium]